MNEITFTINGQQVKGRAGETIFQVAQHYGIPIPTLCNDRFLDPIGACRICQVEDEKRGNLLAACVTPIADGMSIRTDSPKVIETQKVIVKLMMASHPDSCIVCEKGNRCKLRQIAADLGIGLIDFYPMPNFTGTHEVNPFIARDLSKCILCAKCIRADLDLVVEGAIDYMDRGFEARPATIADAPLEASECTFCGTCVELCPTGALFEKDRPYRGSAAKRTLTTCSFCGCGCSIWLETADDKVVAVRPGVPDSVNGMTLCVKGHYGYEYINNPGRLKNPLVRKDSRLVDASWDEAFQVAADGLLKIKTEKGRNSLAILTSLHCTNEEAFIIKQFASNVLETKYINSTTDSFYISNLLQAMQESVGFLGTKSSLKDIETAEAVLLIGANPTETAPILGYNIKRNVRRNKAALIVIDPVAVKLTKFARIWLRPFLCSDGILLSCFLRFLVENNCFYENITERDLKNLERLKQKTEGISLKSVEKTTGVSLENIRESARLFCLAKKRAIVFGSGVVQQTQGKDLVKMIYSIGSLVENITNNETMFFPLIKQSNAMGCAHMGIINNVSPQTIFEEIRKGHIRGLWVIGEDPLVSLPGTKEVANALDSLDLLVVSDSFLSRTGEKAQVVFPSVTFAEKLGTITNMEGRVQVLRPALSCVGESRPDWSTIFHVAKRFGTLLNFKSEKEITEQITKTLPIYAKMHISPPQKQYCSYKLPVLNEKDRQYFYLQKPSAKVPSADKVYPYTLMLGSVVSQLGCGYQTSHSPRLCRMTENEYVEISPGDASREGIKQLDMVILISSEGEKRIRAQVSERVPPGVLFMPLPFIQECNFMPHPREAGMRKAIKVRIERVKT